jgi:molybdopterin molybdotransferase
LEDTAIKSDGLATKHDFSGPNTQLVSVERALEIVLASARIAESEDVSLTDAVGRILKAPVKADDDMPRYDQVAIDGVALQSASLGVGKRFEIVAIQRAGVARLTLGSAGECIEVMAGSVLPEGSDCVMPYEALEIHEGPSGRHAEILTVPARLEQYIHWRGTDRRKGDLLIEPGTEITAAEIAVAASTGKSYLRVAALPRIAVITTGDELVSVDVRPLPFQMRESNSYALSVILKGAGVDCDRFHLPDDPDVIASSIAEWTMTYDVLLFSGGSSKGVGDYLPTVLKNFGVQPLFHGVSQRPGKPFWFGTKAGGAHGELTVFSLPGNPISSFVCAHLYCLPWLQKSFGRKPAQKEYARLARTIRFELDLTHFLPVKLTEQLNGTLDADPIEVHGAGDHAGLLSSDAFMEFPAGIEEFVEGEVLSIIRYR